MSFFARLSGLGIVAVALTLAGAQINLKGKPDVVAKDKYSYKGMSTKVEGVFSYDGGKFNAWKPDGSPYPALEKFLTTAHLHEVDLRAAGISGKKVRYIVLKSFGKPVIGQRTTVEGAGNILATGASGFTEDVMPGDTKGPGLHYNVRTVVEDPSAKTTRIRLRVFEMYLSPLSLKCRVGAKGTLGKESFKIDEIGRAVPGPKDLNPYGKMSVWYVKLTRPVAPSNLPDVAAGPFDEKGDMIRYADPLGNPAQFTPPPGKGMIRQYTTASINYQVYNLPTSKTEVKHGKTVDSITCYTRVNPAVVPQFLINSSRTIFVDLTGIRLDPKP